MPLLTGTEIYKSRDAILADLFASLQAQIPDVYTGPDGTISLIFTVEASQIENVYLALQILLEDMFIPTASLPGLQRFGDQYGVPQKTGTAAVGSLLFSGAGGIYIPEGTEVSYVPGGGADPLFYLTTASATTPAPGIPTPPSVGGGGAGGLTGTYEYAVSFLTDQGETLIGAESSAFVAAANQISVTNIPLGGPGTVARNLYRMKNGGPFGLVARINDNTTTVFVDNIADGSIPGNAPPTVSTAQAVLVPAASSEPGIVFNAVPGAITILDDAPDGITAVTNPQPFTGGTDPEEIEDYRARLLARVRSPGTGAPSDLQSWAELVPGVESASVFSNDNNGTPQNGHTTIRITGPGGSIPSADVIAAVQSSLEALDLANITIHVTTFTANIINSDVTVTPSVGNTVAEVTVQVQQAISDYINAVAVGGTVYVAGIIDAVFGLPGIDNVIVNIPADDVTNTPVQKPIAGTVAVH